MNKAAHLKPVNILDLKVGDIVHALGARFEITKVVIHEEKDPEFIARGLDKIMCANGKWIDGQIVRGYFGPDQDYYFQGNANVQHMVEIGGAK